MALAPLSLVPSSPASRSSAWSAGAGRGPGETAGRSRDELPPHVPATHTRRHGAQNPPGWPWCDAVPWPAGQGQSTALIPAKVAVCPGARGGGVPTGSADICLPPSPSCPQPGALAACPPSTCPPSSPRRRVWARRVLSAGFQAAHLLKGSHRPTVILPSLSGCLTVGRSAGRDVSVGLSFLSVTQNSTYLLPGVAGKTPGVPAPAVHARAGPVLSHVWLTNRQQLSVVHPKSRTA